MFRYNSNFFAYHSVGQLSIFLNMPIIRVKIERSARMNRKIAVRTVNTFICKLISNSKFRVDYRGRIVAVVGYHTKCQCAYNYTSVVDKPQRLKDYYNPIIDLTFDFCIATYLLDNCFNVKKNIHFTIKVKYISNQNKNLYRWYTLLVE